MSVEFISLNNRIITDDGKVVATYELLVDTLLSNKQITGLEVKNHPDVLIYNQRIGKDKLNIWEPDGTISGPNEKTFEWNIPEKYRDMDIMSLAFDSLEQKHLSHIPHYVDRFEYEIIEMNKRGMFPFVQCLLYIRDTFIKRKIVWGVGRGSSVASLILYLLGINKIDPVKHDIPKEEFFK